MNIPKELFELISYIEANGFEAYIVGGAVRDMLLDIEPTDFDIATSARPEDLKELFRFAKVIDTGIEHGTVTIVVDKNSYEVTTFRTDGDYKDYRHPSEVHFGTSLKEDLARRDFTINAIAYHPEKGIIDPFNGIRSLQDGVLQTVGDPKKRFQEDPLRILRGLRFLSRFGLFVEYNTKKAMLDYKDLIFFVSKERIFKELQGILLGKYVNEALNTYREVFSSFIPELEDTFYVKLPSGELLYDHIVRVTSAVKPTIPLRLAALLHDIGKPHVMTNENGVVMFPEHAKYSDEMARRILLNLRVDYRTSFTVTQLIRYHSVEIEYEPFAIKEWLNKLGKDLFLALLDLKEADAIDKEEKYEHVLELKRLTNEILFGQSAFELSHLRINGTDLIKEGINEGTTIGLILDTLLKEVMQGKLENEHSALIARAKELR
ncbi:CCA tRNA nucleotidyltransferase [Guggenheimella bovis]